MSTPSCCQTPPMASQSWQQSKLTALGKPAILIPFPHAAGRHQEFNAMKLREMGAAMVMLEDDLGGEALAGAIREVYLNADLRAEMKSASKGLGRPDACTKIVDVAMSLMRNG